MVQAILPVNDNISLSKISGETGLKNEYSDLCNQADVFFLPPGMRQERQTTYFMALLKWEDKTFIIGSISSEARI